MKSYDHAHNTTGKVTLRFYEDGCAVLTLNVGSEELAESMGEAWKTGDLDIW